MEQCSTSKVAAATVHYQFAAVSMVLLFWAQLLYANPNTDPLAAERDYLLPAESHGGFIYTPSNTRSTQQGNDKQSTTVNYQAFDGASYVLEPHAGRYVTVLLPPTGAPFTEDHMEELLDRLDILYSTYQELMQGEPDGPGLLTIAFVAETCGLACGYVGSKGIEIRQDPNNYEKIMVDLAAGKLNSILTHEMAHNFDLYAEYLHYLPDHAHAWTAMFEFFAPYRFARESNHQQQPDDLYRSPPGSVWKSYLADGSANWEICVRDQLCRAAGFTENNLWAMIYYRIEALHGMDAVLDSFTYLNSYARSNVPPKSVQQKEDLRLLSLAVGANTNISCYLDTLKWSISPTLRSDLQARFGSGSEFCTDDDQDGYSVIAGDCDDRDTTMNPGRLEVQGNGIDDDCDNVRDELTLIETATTDLPGFSPSLVEKQLPLEIKANLSNLQDRDAVRFALPPNGRVEVELCAQDGFDGWVTALQANGQFLQSAFWFESLAVTGCSRKAFDFGAMSNGNLEVVANQAAGPYTLTVSAAKDVPTDFSPLLQVVPRASGGMNIVVDDKDGILSKMGTDELEVWVSGQAVKLSVPYAAQTTIPLNNASAAGLTSLDRYQVRIRPRKNNHPVAGFSAGHLFRYDANPQAIPSLDGSYSGAWYDPDHNGEGFIVEVHENGQALVYWFTYTPDGEQRWMLGVGEVRGNSIVISELLRTHGGRFGDGFNPEDVTFAVSGSLSIAFLDCNNAILNYSVDNNGDHQNLIRLSEVHGHRCGKPAESLTADLSGSWYDPAHGGEGFIVQQLSDELALVFWFSYTSTGEQAWMFNTGTIKNGGINVEQLLQTSGGRFGRSFEPATVIQSRWGYLAMQLDCNAGTATYDSSAADFSSGSQQLVPLTRLQHSGCAR